MKVLHFYKTYLPAGYGGAQRVIFEICEGTRGYGIESEVLALCPQDEGARRVGRHRVHLVRRIAQLASTDLSLSVIGKFRALAADADIVHYHFPWPLMDVGHFLVRHNKPSVVTYHSDIVRQRALYQFYKPLMHRFLADATAIVATSSAYARTSSVLQRYRSKVRVVPIGIDDPHLTHPDPALVARWQAKLGRGFFLFIGVARSYKSLDVLREAVRGTELPVVIAGAGNCGSSRAHRRSGFDNVTYTGAVSEADKGALLHLCGAVVLPSALRSEAFGIVLLEGAMLAKPLICCELGTGTTYVNIDELTGLAVPPGDARALRCAMERLHRNPHEARRFGHNARERYLALFTRGRMARSYYDIYQAAAARARPSTNGAKGTQHATPPTIHQDAGTEKIPASA